MRRDVLAQPTDTMTDRVGSIALPILNSDRTYVDGQASIEHQIDIHVLDMVASADAVMDVLYGIKYLSVCNRHVARPFRTCSYVVC